MPVKIYSCLVQGIEGKLIEVEADILLGLSDFIIVGLGDKSVQEAKDRIRSAIKDSEIQYPTQKKIINLAPAHLKKQGPSFDLPMAVSLILASGQIKSNTYNDLQNTLIVGELALNGNLRPVKNIFSIALFARENKFSQLIIPADNYDEASLVSDVKINGLKNLQEVIDFLNKKERKPEPPRNWESALGPIHKANSPEPSETQPSKSQYPPHPSIFSSIQGLNEAKNGLKIAAAGGHHILLFGPPGVGKTMLAKALNELQPRLTDEEFYDLVRIFSAAGLPINQLMNRERPFRQIHQSSSPVSVLGGGNPIVPGELSLAHHGVMFLDEMPEFPRSILESLRQPLEDRQIHIARQGTQVTFPTKFTLVAAMNPCPCGYFGDERKPCVCTAYQIRGYRHKLSGPILDRIDLTIQIPRQEINLKPQANTESPQKIQCQVQIARERQQHRYKNYPTIHLNSDLNSTNIRKFVDLDPQTEDKLKSIKKNLFFSPRQQIQLLRTSLTLADLQNRDKITSTDLLAALQFKNNIPD